MERLTAERVNGIKTGYWSAAKKDELIQRLGEYEDTGLTPEEIRETIKLRRADEMLASYMDDPEAIEDRKKFVRNLGWLLSQTRDGVTGCELVDIWRGTERVIVTYKGGSTKDINVHMDSYAAIIRDVARRFQ